MIKLADGGDFLTFAEDYYGGRTEAYFRAYGMGYDFCRFCRSGENGLIMLFNSSAVLSGEIRDIPEAEEFIVLHAPDTVECPPEISAEFSLPGYERYRRLCFEVKPRFPGEDFAREVCSPPPLREMYEIISASFGETDLGLWYTDMSHRIRHGVSRAYICKNAGCLAVDFIRGGKAYISQTAVLPEMRGRGIARSLLGYAAAELAKENAASFLWCYPELESFYRSFYCEKSGEDTVFIRS